LLLNTSYQIIYTCASSNNSQNIGV